jgi:uncharacterized protein
MPIIHSSYSPPVWLRGRSHLQTVLPSALRKVTGVAYIRERLDTPDGDFLDLDWTGPANSLNLVVLSHGLEGSADRPYILGMARAFAEQGWRVLAWNLRGCSGEPNRLERFYHHGATDDLDLVLRHVLALGQFTQIVLIGFSLGGNLTLKYLGEQGDGLPSVITKAIAFSVPADLVESVPLLRTGAINRFYGERFKNKIVAKVQAKAQAGIIPMSVAERVGTFKTLDDLTEHYAAPLHGFRDATDYYLRNSSLPLLPRIEIPTLILNAANDPMLSASCSPVAMAAKSSLLHVEVPEQGGHCGFRPPQLGAGWMYWSEQRALEFVLSN